MSEVKLSVIIPVLNGEVPLKKCLQSLKDQDFPFSNLEILVVDDDSTDGTVEVAKSFGATIIRNGAHHIEKGKALGLREASHEFVLFVDADNYLPRTDWLTIAVEALQSSPDIVGTQASRFHYERSDPAANRYCSLMGINDPMAYYLGNRDRLTGWEEQWNLLGKIEEETENWWLLSFSKEGVPTIGSQVFLIRKSLLQKAAHWPLLFHMDANVELIRQGYNRYALLKLDVGHDHCVTVGGFIKKCRRNLDLFFKYRHLRQYTWDTPRLKFLLTVVSMVTVIRPLFAALRGFIRQPDAAWFIHVWVSFAVPVMYTWQTLFQRPQPIKNELPGREMDA